MEKFFNDIVTFIAQMDLSLKIAIIALLAVLDLLVIRAFVKSVSNKEDKPKIRIITVILFIIFSGLLVLISVYGF